MSTTALAESVLARLGEALPVLLILLGVLLGYVYADTNAATKHRMRAAEEEEEERQQVVATFPVVVLGKGAADAATLRGARQRIAQWRDPANEHHWRVDMIGTGGRIRLDVWNVVGLGGGAWPQERVMGAIVLDDERLRNAVVEHSRALYDDIVDERHDIVVVATEHADHLDGDSFVVLGRMLQDQVDRLKEEAADAAAAGESTAGSSSASPSKSAKKTN